MTRIDLGAAVLMRQLRALRDLQIEKEFYHLRHLLASKRLLREAYKIKGGRKIVGFVFPEGQFDRLNGTLEKVVKSLVGGDSVWKAYEKSHCSRHTIRKIRAAMEKQGFKPFHKPRKFFRRQRRLA